MAWQNNTRRCAPTAARIRMHRIEHCSDHQAGWSEAVSVLSKTCVCVLHNNNRSSQVGLHTTRSVEDDDLRDYLENITMQQVGDNKLMTLSKLITFSMFSDIHISSTCLRHPANKKTNTAIKMMCRHLHTHQSTSMLALMYCCKVGHGLLNNSTVDGMPVPTCSSHNTGGLSSSDTSGSMSDSSSSSSGTSSSSHNNSNHDHQSENPTASTSLAAQYPVQVRDHAQHNMPRRRDRLLPGEKKRLRKEAIKAKRAARGGLEVLNVNERLRAMVMDDVDMEVCLVCAACGVQGGNTAVCVFALQPFAYTTYTHNLQGFEASRNAAHVVVRMANCYGLKATMQGSGKRKTVLVQQTSHSALPHGGQVQLLEDIVSTEIQRQQRHASAGEIGAFPGLVGLRGRGDSDEEGKGKRGQRQKKGKNSKGKKSQRTTGNSGSSSGRCVCWRWWCA